MLCRRTSLAQGPGSPRVCWLCAHLRCAKLAGIYMLWPSQAMLDGAAAADGSLDPDQLRTALDAAAEDFQLKTADDVTALTRVLGQVLCQCCLYGSDASWTHWARLRLVLGCRVAAAIFAAHRARPLRLPAECTNGYIVVTRRR